MIPARVTSTGWPQVRDTCANLGIEFDDWQDGGGRLILAKRKDGSLAATIGGVVISIPRQVGKTFLIGAIIFALCILRPGLLVIWTAHRSRTAGETFSAMQGMAKQPKVAPHIANIVRANGEEEITFHSGSRILFGARERGFGRGFPKVAIIVFDEAQILTEGAVEDMVPATNQVEDALVFYMGTPPRPKDPGEVFTRKRKEALDGEDEDTVYIEFSADDGADLDDRDQWRKANPSYPKRTNTAAMLRMRKALSDDAFQREALGIWDEAGGSELDVERWVELADGAADEASRPTRIALAVEMSNDRRWCTIGLAGIRPDAARHLQIIEAKKGSGWVVARVAELAKRWKPVSIAILASGPAGALIADLEEADLDIRTLTMSDLGKATGMIFDGIEEGTLRHSDQALLNISVGAAATRKMGATKVWDLDGETDIAPLQNVSLALYALLTAPEPDPPRTGMVMGIR